MFCMNCGTQLPDNARFCSSCGAQVAQSASSVQGVVTAPIHSEQVSLDQKAGRVKEIVSNYGNLAKTGPLTDDDIAKAIEIRESVKRITAGVENNWSRSLDCYTMADSTERFFRQRWLSPNTSSKDQQHVRLLQQDWSILVTDFDKLLLQYSGVNSENIWSLRSECNTLWKWLEEKVLRHLLLARFLAGFKLTKDEIAMLVLRFDERASSAIDFATQLASMTRKK